MTQKKGNRSKKDDTAAEATTEKSAEELAAAAKAKAEQDEKTDAVLGEIDEVLEENAEDFVRGFVQKGGQ